jgi:hypothetical protein
MAIKPAAWLNFVRRFRDGALADGEICGHGEAYEPEKH